MAIFLCKCGKVKCGQPWRASGTHKWLCDPCASTSLAEKKTPEIVRMVKPLVIRKAN